jgi:TRAP-type C4-dicarboxylate transport system permease small subunit
MSDGPGGLRRAADYADLGLGVIASAVLFAIMLLTFVDVVMRYVFNDSIRGAFEITELAMVVLIFAGLPLVSRHDQHVTVDFVDRWFAPWFRRALHVVVHLVCCAAMAGMAWLLYRKAGRVVGDGDVTAALQVELWPFVYLMCALAVATAFIHLVKAFSRPPAEDAGGGLV